MNKEDNTITKGKRFGAGIFLIGIIFLMIVVIGDWNPLIFIISQVFMIMGLIIWVIFVLKERKKYPVHEPKWVKHLKQ
jgi:tetrahydromethanopterin S-methyltransferase subunit E